ncbi:MAG: ABC transporter ATP-binding protein [bacterium]|nr:ABC transporter ATP-binding protein [bacterium]
MKMKIDKHIIWIWRNLWSNYKRFIVLLVFITMLSTAVSVSYPFIFKLLIDKFAEIAENRALHPEPMKEIYRIIWIFVIIGIVRIFAGLYPGFRAYMNLVFEYILRKKYFGEILRKDYKFFLKFRTGDLVTRLTEDLSDFPKICWFSCSGIFRAFDSFSKIVFSLAMMAALSWRLTLISILPLPIMVVIFLITSEKLYKRFKLNQEAISEINNQLEMTFSGVKIIKAFVCEEKYRRFFKKTLDRKFDTQMDVVKLDTQLHMVYQYIDQFAQIGVILFGGYMVVVGEISVGTFFAFYTYLAMLVYPMLDLPQLFVSGKQAFVNIDRLEEIKEFPSTPPSSGKKRIEKVDSIIFKNVSFGYEEREDGILRNINFEVRRGERVVIIGPVGAGKSTILSLLTGILKPTRGGIFINGTSVEEVEMSSFREKIGYVPQEPLLFSGTIRENIEFGLKEVKEDAYREAVSVSQIEKEIEGFMDKDRTMIGQRGVNLSGGQKQRIAIARALIRKPEVLILDDITASLDAENEEKLWREIGRIFKDITCFIVSHRLSTIRYVDNVVFMEAGMLVGKDKHEKMVDRFESYRDYIQERTKK